MVLWMLRAISVAGLLSAAALLADAARREAGRPRRWVWLIALILSTLLPVVAPRVFEATPGLGLPTTLRPSDHVAVVYMERATTSTVATIAWIVASLCLLVLFAWAHRRARHAAVGEIATIGGMSVLITDELGPAVVGLAKPRIIVPRWTLDASSREQALIIRHESEHVTARDTLLLALSAAAVVLMPWNPFVWWQSWRLRRAVEMDCDARVLASDCDIAEYGATLIAMVARASCFTPLVPSLGGSRRLLEQRIREMTAGPATRRAERLAPLALLASLLLAGASAAAVPFGPIKVGQERIVTRSDDRTGRPARRASLVLLDGRTSSYEEIRAVARAGRLGPLKIIMPEQAVRVYGTRAATGALIANTK